MHIVTEPTYTFTCSCEEVITISYSVWDVFEKLACPKCNKLFAFDPDSTTVWFKEQVQQELYLKLNAINLLREISNIGLKEAKNMIESVEPFQMNLGDSDKWSLNQIVQLAKRS